ncbi:MAG: lipid-transfer protein [Acidimicrobiia bacterium]
MGRKVFVVGVGMTKFEKPGGREWDYPDMAKEAGQAALADAGIGYDLVEQVAVGYCYGDSTAGQRALYEIGVTGVPVVNVNNNCATGSSALYLAKKFVEGGLAECTFALGFEKMEKGSLGIKYMDRAIPMQWTFEKMNEKRGFTSAPPAPQMFGNAGREYMERYGVKAESFGRIAEKNHRHSANNPNSQFRDIYTLDEIMASPVVHEPLTKLQCCPTSDGSAAAVLASEDFVRAHGLEDRAVEILGMEMTTDFRSSFESDSDMNFVGFEMSRAAARSVYEQSGHGPEDVDVIELHDCFSANEMITYEALGLCGEGKAADLIDSDAVTYGGQWVVNPSGGLISKGHPLGATGLAQCAELNWQLRDMAEARQVGGAELALQHNLGLGGACVVAMYEKAVFA